MKRVDFYTKSVLTVIAVCLLVLTLKSVDIIPSAYASKTGFDNDNIKVNYDGSINVKVIDVKTSFDGIPVEVKKINTPWDGIPVEIKKIDTPYGGIPVEVKNYRDFK